MRRKLLREMVDDEGIKREAALGLKEKNHYFFKELSEMREIKFRGWDGDKMYEPEDLTVAPVHREWLGHIDIELMQYTGLKDRNGQEIYEGDLCVLYARYSNQESNGCAEVVFSHEYVGGWVLTVDGNNKLNIGTRTNCVKVIGNIHENPELIKGAD